MKDLAMHCDTLDARESRDPAEREREQMAALPGLITGALQAPGWARILAGTDAQAIDSRAALAQLPVTRKSELAVLQQAALPFAGLTPVAPGRLRRLFMSPGPIFDPEGHATDYWRFARPMYAAGIRAGDIVHNSFSYHFTPAAAMAEGGAARLGAAIIPAGAGQTEMQVQAMATLRPSAYIGTPSFLRIILEKALEMGQDVSSVRRAVMGAEALPESLRSWFHAHGVPDVFQTYASADAGLIGYETAHEGTILPGFVIDEDVLVEIVQPGSGEPVADGAIGEVLLTVFNPDYPLIRFATGDMSALLPAASSPCGRSNRRLRGWLGRADQTTKVRAMFIHPSQVADILQRHPQILKARLVVSGRMAQDELTLHCEVDDTRATAAMPAIVASIRDVTKLRAEVRFVARGSLPQDGKTIEDARDYS